ncbi:YkgJ family cysteine cluster protein [Bdellovibrio sp. HCB337]|uniref:YkgJ family cysteine cluster protein n=1 Tax=Bdellovibrio sp. HCB337 TaxID=3394358 RepID=UPI0039A5E70E
MAQTPTQHPCLSCGACCAYFRVAFYWREAEPDGIWKVPVKLTVDLDSTYRCMKGTEVKHQNKCVALTGRIGKDAHCSIYQNRPTPCRNFMASYEDGTHNPRCDEARNRHGLRPLCKSDYPPAPETPAGTPQVEKT